MTSKAALEMICNTSGSKELYKHPWQFEREGKPWAMAVDGFRILLVAEAGGWTSLSLLDQGLYKRTIDTQFAPLEQETTLPFAELLEFIQQGITDQPVCPQCGRACSWCDDEKDKPMMGWYRGIGVNRRLLADVLPLLEATEVTVGTNEKLGGACFYVWAAGWRFALMGMNVVRRPDSKDPELRPVFV